MGKQDLTGMHVLPFIRVQGQTLFGIKHPKSIDAEIVPEERLQYSIFGGGRKFSESPYANLVRELTEEDGLLYLDKLEHQKERYVVVKKLYNEKGYLISVKTRCIHVSIDHIEWDTELPQRNGSICTLSIVALLRMEPNDPGTGKFMNVEECISSLANHHKTLFVALLPYLVGVHDGHHH